MHIYKCHVCHGFTTIHGDKPEEAQCSNCGATLGDEEYWGEPEKFGGENDE